MKLLSFIKHPSKEIEIDENNSNPLVATELDLTGNPDFQDWLPLITRSRAFEKSKNPIDAIESIILCHDAGLYPSVAALDWMVTALKKWHSENGLISMEHAMGLKKLGQTGNAMREAIKKEYEQNLMIELNRLRKMFGLTNKEAAQMIAVRLEDTDWNDSGYRLPIFSEETIQDKFERRWAKFFNDEIHAELSIELKNAPDNEKKETLSHYPRHAYEHLSQMSRFL